MTENPQEIRSLARATVTGVWAVTIFWNLLAIPTFFVYLRRAGGFDAMAAFLLLFPLAGAWLLARAIRLTANVRQWGDAFLSLEPRQPRPGERVELDVRFERPPPAGQYRLALRCELVDLRGDGTEVKSVWREEQTTTLSAGKVAAAFIPPATLPPTGAYAPTYHRWRVELEMPQAGHREFEVILQPVAPMAAAPAMPATMAG